MIMGGCRLVVLDTSLKASTFAAVPLEIVWYKRFTSCVYVGRTGGI